MTRRTNDEQEQERVVVRDKRRLDPVSGELREPAPVPAEHDSDSSAMPASEPGQNVAEEKLTSELAERTADLQRLQAEFANYRKRVERDRLAVADHALASLLVGLLPVLDDVGRARAHGELAGGFKSVAESLDGVVTKLGLVRFGQPGEPFDPMVHEALMHTLSPDVDEPTCVEVLQPGYRLGDRVLRPARVAVAEPGAPDPEPA